MLHEPIVPARPVLSRRERDRLVLEHRPTATAEAGMARRRWPTLDRDDLFGIALLALVEAVQTWDPALGDLGPRVRIVARNRLYDHARTEFEACNKTAELKDNLIDPAADAARLSVENRIDLVRGLHPDALPLASMRLEGMTLQEVGDVVGCSRSTVLRRIQRARKETT